MNSTRDYITEKAFEQYLTNGYEGVSISVLQKSLNIGRATLYYHFSNKEDLFNEVINVYVTSIFQKHLGMIDKSIVTIPDLIQIFTDMHEFIKQAILRTNISNAKFSNYTSLIIHAYMHNPNFADFMHYVIEETYQSWVFGIKNSIKKGEVREDINVNILASIFTGIKDNVSLGLDDKIILLPNEDNNYNINCLYLSNLIKK
ncbi:MAG TPA: TetR/AcrR family transcriptional regulator [Paludibacteraceae bacterium]|nr:TetR/AcrR family transcriptional regulator [Paludibacteraceae bacterium]HPH62801.1 TetR/AcrR family transcriptional regulator [Paludibacteraceae bacterium]